MAIIENFTVSLAHPSDRAANTHVRRLNMDNTDHLRSIGDAFSFATVIGALAGWLPSVAALFTIIWTGIRIYETRTVQRLLRRR